MDACDARRRCIAWPACCTTSASRARARSPTRPTTTRSTITRSSARDMADALAQALPLLERRARARRAPRAPPPGLLLGRVDRRRGAPLRAARRARPRRRPARPGARRRARPRAATCSDELAALERLRARIEQAQAQGAAFGLRDLAIDGGDVMQRLGIAPGRARRQSARGAATTRARRARAQRARRAAAASSTRVGREPPQLMRQVSSTCTATTSRRSTTACARTKRACSCARRSSASATPTVAATPHIRSGMFENRKPDLVQRFERVRRAAARDGARHARAAARRRALLRRRVLAAVRDAAKRCRTPAARRR